MGKDTKGKDGKQQEETTNETPPTPPTPPKPPEKKKEVPDVPILYVQFLRTVSMKSFINIDLVKYGPRTKKIYIALIYLNYWGPLRPIEGFKTGLLTCSTTQRKKPF